MYLHLHPEIPLGAMKPLHGIDNGPLSMGGYYDLSEEYREMGVPFVRLHDTDYPYPQAVDVYQIFRDFSKDPTDPANYDFLLTDQYITAIHNVGTQIIYRLGTSIEHMKEKRYIAPPEDTEKFAIVCEHIIRHFNEGWANGFRYGIRYWEIWNEPEGNCMWSGSKEDYFHLYEAVSKHLCRIFGNTIRIGGYASSGLYGSELPAEKRQDWQNNWISFFEAFLCFVRKTACPFDFFSFHYYGTNPAIISRYITYAREHVTTAGFPEALIILDEWNAWAYDWITEMRGAKHVLSMMHAFANAPLDIATYYDGQPHMGWCGLFDRLRQKKKPFYAFCLYNKLYRLGTRVSVESDDNIVCLAATNGQNVGLLLVGMEEDISITIQEISASAVHAQLLDDANDLADYPIAVMNANILCTLPQDAVIYIEMEM